MRCKDKGLLMLEWSLIFTAVDLLFYMLLSITLNTLTELKHLKILPLKKLFSTLVENI